MEVYARKKKVKKDATDQKGLNDVASVKAEESWHESPWSVGASFRGVLRSFGGAFLKRPITTFILCVLVIGTIFVERNLLQPFVLVGRTYFGAALMVLFFGLSGWFFVRKRSARWRAFASLTALVIALTITIGGRGIHDYVTSYWRYRTLKIVDLSALPTTDHERIIPLNGIYSFINERINETEMSTFPDLVRTDEKYEWTAAIAPTYFIQRFIGRVDEVVHLSSTTASPELSKKSRDVVSFTAGEQLPFSRKIETCTRRSFGPWRFLNYEPDNTLFMRDDTGSWVQVVTLIKWKGIFFPWPEFGGVQVINQAKHDYSWNSFFDFIPYVLNGCGKWIPAEEIKHHKFLKGQNIMPPFVSRFMAESIRFQEGFLGPLPGNRVGDLRIADLPEDMNPQPFTLFFRILVSKVKDSGKGKLFQYFALEPYDNDKQGLSTSFFVPADGIGPHYAYRHFKRGESALGVSAVADYVRNSKKNYDWIKNTPVEHRPYIRTMQDASGVSKERFFWMTTIVTQKQERKDGVVSGFVSGTVPEIALTDIHRGTVVWVSALQPEEWPAELQKMLGSIWARD